MVVNAQTGIQRQPPAYILPEIHIAGYFVLALVNYILTGSGILTFYIFRPSLPAIAEPVETECYAVAFKKPGTLVKRDTHHIVKRIEPPVLRRLSGSRRIAVVNPMLTPVIKETQTAGCTLIPVLQCKRRHPTSDSLVAFQQGCGNRAGIRGIEMRHVDIRRSVPIRRQVVPEFGITAILLELHIVAVSVCPVIRTTHHRRETAFPHTVCQLRFQSVVRAITGTQIRLHSILTHLPRDYVNHTSHGIRAVKHGSRATEHLHPVGQQRLVRVGNRMPENTGILGMSVNQHHQLRRTAAQSPQRNSPGCSVRHPIAHHTPRSDKQPRHLLCKHRQKRRLKPLLNLFPVNHRNSLRQMAHVSLASRTGNYKLFQRTVDRKRIRLLRPHRNGKRQYHTANNK